MEADAKPSLGESVAPGINDSFLAEDLDVEAYTARFEGESREVAVGRDALVERLGLAPGEAVADIGAGTGLFTAALARKVGETGKVYAVDISPKFIEHIKKRMEIEGLSQVETVLGEAASVGLPAASVDVVWICDTYHHFEFPAPTLASIFRAMRPGGRLFIVDFKRIPSESPPWILEHMRAGQEVFQAEIEEAGFVFEGEVDAPELSENYMLRFRRP